MHMELRRERRKERIFAILGTIFLVGPTRVANLIYEKHARASEKVPLNSRGLSKGLEISRVE